jgi:hypothetical protein
MDDKLKGFLDEAPVLLGMDFGPLESRMLIQLMTAKPDGTFIYTPVDPEEFYKDGTRSGRMKITGRDFDFIIIDEYGDFPTPAPVEEFFDQPPIKQNGRSAAYLAYDPTKRHRRQKHIRS